MRILVTGANGFVGSRVCPYIAAAGHAVRAHLRRADPAFPVPDQVVVPEICPQDGPVVDWSPALAGVDVVLHLAGRAHIVKESALDPGSEFRRVNVEGTRRLAAAAAAAGVRRFVFVSSIKANGEESSRTGFSEADAPTPTTPYGQSKLEAEAALWQIQRDTGLAVTVVRPPLVYGAHATANFAALQRLVTRGLPIPLGNANNLRTLIGVDNLAAFLLRCCDHPRAAGELFLIGDAESVSTRELVHLMGQAAGRPARLFPAPSRLMTWAARLVGRPEMARALFGTLVVNSTKAQTLLEWSQPVTLEEGLRRSFAS